MGAATISGVTIRYGKATAGSIGGGIAVTKSGFSLTLINSTLSGNHADSSGGGIWNNVGSTVTVTNSTFSANHVDSSGGSGGGIYHNGGTLTVTNSTLSANTANGNPGRGGGIYLAGSTLAANNILIAGNTATGTGGIHPDVDGAYATGSKNNLLGNPSGATGISDGDANHNIVGHAALLDSTLRDNGTTNGTQTLALLTGSPAINAGDNPTCTNTSGTAPVAGKDQRGIARPQPSSGQCDIGAYEYVFPATATTLTAGPNPATVGQAVTFTAMVTGGSGTPTGSVTFKDGATVLGGGTLFSGVATFGTSALAAGSHAITAVYSGDTIFAPSTSAVLTQTVTGGPPSPSGLQFYPLTKPVRLLDTRNGATAFVHPNTPLSPGQTLLFPGQFTYQGVTIPPSAQAIVGNATVANGSNGTPAGFATLFPSGVPLPLTSNLNFVPGTVRPNNFTVALGGDTKFNLYSSSGGDFVIDISGYYAPVGAGGLYFHPLSAPVRELDTRSGAAAFVHPNATLPGPFTFAGITVPAGAKALVGNATVANDGNSTPAGFATLYPGGVPLPLASNLNFVAKQVAPNAVVVGIGGDGSYNLYSSSGGDFIIDISGYFAAPGGAAPKPATAPVKGSVPTATPTPTAMKPPG